MDKKLIEEQTLLAVFEGAISQGSLHYMMPALNRIIWVEKMLYSSDWNWIMRIVDLIESKDTIFTIWHEHATIELGDFHKKELEFSGDGSTKIEAVYTVCVEFIQWYNANLKEDGSN